MMSLPKGWKTEKIGDVARVSAGGTPNRQILSYWDGDIPWITTGQIGFNVICHSEEKITAEGVKKSAAKIFPAGTVLMAMYGQGVTRGKVAVLGIDATFNQACAAIVPHAADTKFFYYLLESNYQQLRYFSNSGSQDNLSAALIKSFQVTLPPLPEQREIARILGVWDDAIGATTQLIADKTKFKRGLMQQLLTGERRFAEFEGQAWHEYKLGEVFYERNEANRPDLPLLSITADRGIVRHGETARKDNSNKNKAAYLRIAPGDIGYNTMRMWQGVSALSQHEGIISPAYTVCAPNEHIDAKFAAYLFKTSQMISLFNRHSQGMVADTLSLKFVHFARLPITLPPTLAEQRRIVDVLDAATAEIDLLQQQLDALKTQKRGLMQLLLSGEKRVV